MKSKVSARLGGKWPAVKIQEFYGAARQLLRRLLSDTRPDYRWQITELVNLFLEFPDKWSDVAPRALLWGYGHSLHEAFIRSYQASENDPHFRYLRLPEETHRSLGLFVDRWRRLEDAEPELRALRAIAPPIGSHHRELEMRYDSTARDFLRYRNKFPYYFGHVLSKEELYRAKLDELEQETDRYPELRHVFAAHSFFVKNLQWKVEVIDDLPAEKFGSRPGEPILDFIRRVWTSPYLYCGFADASDIKSSDPAAFRAIEWPPKLPRAADLHEFLRNNWSALISVGIGTRSFIRVYDESLDNAISNHLRHDKNLKPLPPTLRDLNSRALISPSIPKRHLARLAILRSNRERKPLKEPDTKTSKPRAGKSATRRPKLAK